MQPTKPDPTGNPFPPPPPPQPCAEAPAVKSVEENLRDGNARDRSVISKLRVYQDLCERAAQIIQHDTRNPQVEKWWEDYEATL